MANAKNNEELAQHIAGIIEDPQTKGFKFVATTVDGHVHAYGGDDGQEKSLAELAAGALLHSAEDADSDDEQFLKDVVEEYNTQKKASIRKGR